MNIAFLYKYFPNQGGVERVMSILANEFIRMGHCVIIYSLQSPLKNPCYELNPNVKLFNLPHSLQINCRLNETYLQNELNKHDINILLNHDTTPDSIELVSKLKHRVKSKIISLHHGQIYIPYSSSRAISKRFIGLNPRRVAPVYYLYDKVRRLFRHKRNIRICDGYAVLCKFYKEQLVTPKNRNKIDYFYNPLSFLSTVDDCQFYRKNNEVIIVGRMAEIHKRISYSLKIWQLIEQRPELNEWRLKIIGDGPDLDYYKQLSQTLKLTRVTFCGFTNPEPYYKSAKLLFMTSTYEGFPLVLMEASQFGCVPIVMNSFQSLSELISNDVNGIITNNDDIQLFADKASALMSDSYKLSILSKNAIENCQRFAPAEIAEHWISFFNTILTPHE